MQKEQEVLGGTCWDLEGAVVAVRLSSSEQEEKSDLQIGAEFCSSLPDEPAPTLLPHSCVVNVCSASACCESE